MSCVVCCAVLTDRLFIRGAVWDLLFYPFVGVELVTVYRALGNNTRSKPALLVAIFRTLPCMTAVLLPGTPTRAQSYAKTTAAVKDD